MRIQTSNVNQPAWKEINVHANLPENLKKLEEIAYNLWWVWNSDAKNIFRHIDNEAWHRAQSNPILLLRTLSYDKLVELGKDASFMAQLDKIYADFRAYMDEKKDAAKPSIAYFSMEYGLSHVLKIYSGGLGILAGDYLKEASDCNVDMTAVGFLYRYGYFTQTLSPEGQQVANYEAQNFANLPLKQVKNADGSALIVEVPYPGRVVYAYLWQVQVGRINLYLLDTDNEMNSEYDRPITHQLYGGDWENRIKQEIMLGIGGMLALGKLGIKKDVYHCNEGHAAFINIQRLVDLVQGEGLTLNQAMEVVRSSSLYTCHTPVPAGHDAFEEGLFYKYMNEYPAKLGIEWGQFIDMGREHPGSGEKFSMSVFACNCSQEVNGVSWLHGKVSQKMFAPIWPGYFPDELHVDYVTNGVHMPTWAASEWKQVYKETFPQEWYTDQSNLAMWEPFNNLSEEMIWKTRMSLKTKLINYIKEQFQEDWMKNQGDPSRIVRVLEEMNPNTLIIGFGRRFATYKRAHLLFTDLERLDRLVNNPNYPVQFLFTGKAHPADGGGQALIRRIIEISRMPQFLGKIVFLENYDMRLAKRLISGVDIWLNTPTRPLEASGTSGEKAQMNGVLNFSVLDGWWYEGYVEGAGWALTEKRTYENQAHQDQLDAATIYQMLERQIIPMYYAKNSKGYSPEWIEMIKKSVTQITPRFTTKRMMDDYFSKFYNKQAKRHAWLCADNYKKAKEIAAWKEHMVANWDAVEVSEVIIPEQLTQNPQVGERYRLAVTIDTKCLNDKGLGVELVAVRTNKQNEDKLYKVQELQLVKTEGTRMYFETDYQLDYAGALKFAFRMFPKNEDLPHRQDFCYVRWI
ncbi:MAG: alpha-glucan family phosphorylase [Paludibacter sp.]|nr:alpha-glucan family phosphorylase [Bacteroidales bacterium]MCM1069342.1 alpha-glucan family phosphorylase [Prevotella sp.]MCM1353862.1 alpha-glucan family phosphorylase [Bacteroides sp.]MCM1442888.1 alpha-glucan family phosphorylase [Muribaculum sp.]MCM1481933.1 alpha-glucan family phosphorylase [Paludibacter sp.]